MKTLKQVFISLHRAKVGVPTGTGPTEPQSPKENTSSKV